MTKLDVIPQIVYVLNDALSLVPKAKLRTDARLIGWYSEFDPMFVAVQSFLPDVVLDKDEAIEIAMEYLDEIGWYLGIPTYPDFCL